GLARARLPVDGVAGAQRRCRPHALRGSQRLSHRLRPDRLGAARVFRPPCRRNRGHGTGFHPGHRPGQASFAHPFERAGGDAGEVEGLRRRNSSSREVVKRSEEEQRRAATPPSLTPHSLSNLAKSPARGGAFFEKSGMDAGLIFALMEERKSTALNPPSASADARDAPARPAT